MLKVFSVSLGCPKNRVDTEHILGSIGQIKLVSGIKKSDIVFINTCGFIEPAVKESVQTILELISELVGIDIKKRPFLVVAGCLVGRYGAAAITPDLPEVDLWLSNTELKSWPYLLLKAYTEYKKAISAQSFFSVKSRKTTKLFKSEQAIPLGMADRFISAQSYAYLKISDGCKNKCSFCTIPSIRGALSSFPQELITNEAKELIQRGVSELVLVAQDLTAYGADLGLKDGLARLLDKLMLLDGLRRLRLMYLYPAGLTKNLLAHLKTLDVPFLPYFDVPVQHAHPDILKQMGRPFAADPERVIDNIREYFPEAALRTSLIVGFPGEDALHFDYLLNFTERIKFQHLGVFVYKPEQSTKAATMKNQVAETIKEERRAGLLELQAEISAAYLENFVGEKLSVLVDDPQGEWPGLFVGRAWFQAPEVDGLVYLSGSEVQKGKIVEVDIVEAKNYDLVGLGTSAEEL